MFAILVSVLAVVAFGAWIVALASAVSLWRMLPAGHQLKNVFSLGWLQFDSIRDTAGSVADPHARRYVYALVVFFVTIAAFMALAVVIFVTGQNA
ncbi:MAG: hypothetical protein EOP19_03400 [Hyphomicrobiales bacterium]|nr:MAG: hypothetical protein EOP19_03400 [Hyphomicrobiales bacterium]